MYHPQEPHLANGTISKARSITCEIDLTLLVGNGFPPYYGTFQVMLLGSAPISLGIPFLRALRPQFDCLGYYRYHQAVVYLSIVMVHDNVLLVWTVCTGYRP